MEENAFDDEYRKCSRRMEVKYALQLLREEMADEDLLREAWSNAEISWEDRKAQILYPPNFKDTYGIALMAYVTEARKKSVFYYAFNRAVQRAGQSRQDYIYDFQFKSFHFYLVRALQLLRRPCEESYKNVVYITGTNVSFAFGGQNQARLGECTLAYSAKPLTANNQQVLAIRTCFGVPVDRFFIKESEEIVLIPLNEVFQVSRDGTGSDLILQSMNKTCSHFQCSFLGGECMSHPLALGGEESGAGPGEGQVFARRDDMGGFQSLTLFLYPQLTCQINTRTGLLKFKQRQNSTVKQSPLRSAGPGSGQKHFLVVAAQEEGFCSLLAK